MGSDTLDWLKKVGPTSKAKSNKVSFDYEDESAAGEALEFKKPQANAIKTKYSSKDLTGLQVAHDFDSFVAGQSDILILDDTNVLDNSSIAANGDSLVSLNIKEEERLRRVREVARHAKGYSGYKEYEEHSEDSVITLGRKPVTAKVLKKYDFATAEFIDEPALKPEGFRIGSKLPVKNECAPHSSTTTHLAEFDTVQSSGQETISFRKKKLVDSEKELKRAKKLAKSFFADEPEMQVEAESTEGMIEGTSFGCEEDDFEIQKMISAARRENLQTSAMTLKDENVESEHIFKGGKSFDSLMLVESIFSNTAKEPIEEASMSSDYITEQPSVIHQDDEMEIQNNSDEDEEVAFSAEPLVRNGVAATLALLNSRGISLKPRSSNQSQKSGDKTPQSDIKLEYFDQFGNKLSTKEAYKELSRKFHGKGPGKGRLEKMKRKREESLRIESSTSLALNQSAIVSNLRSHQEETGAPYMIISNQRSTDVVILDPTPELGKTSEVKKPKIFGMKM